MENWFAASPPVSDAGTDWLSWLAAAGVTLFVLLAALAVVFLIFANSPLANSLRGLAPSLRGRTITAFVMVATLPLISLGLVLAERSADQRLERMSASLRTGAADLSAAAAGILGEHLAGIVDLAAQIQSQGERDRAAVATWLKSHHATNRSFVSLLVADRSGRVIAATTLAGGAPRLFPRSIERISERDYFQKPLISGLPFISDAYQDRGPGEDAVVDISAPLLDADGEVWGIVEGSLNLNRFASLEAVVGDVDPSAIVLADQLDRIIYASPITGYRPLSRVEYSLSRNASRVPPGQAFSFSIRAGSGATREAFIGARHSVDNGWQILLLAPARTIETALLAELWVTAAWMVAAILMAVWVAIAVTNSVSRPLQRLEALLEAVEIDIGATLPAPDADTPREIVQVHERITSTIARMRSNYERLLGSLTETEGLRADLAASLENRDAEVKARTEELQRANMALHLLNRTDSLTGLANRQGFTEFLDQVWGLSVREEHPLSLICLDIDHFKAYNDEYGHPAGDRCLRAVAGAVNGAARRPLDHVARNGGEEFVAVLGDTTLGAALKVAEEMRCAVEGLRIPHSGSAGGRWVTVSIGVATTVPNRDDDSAQLLESADQALYAAKNKGRNRVAYLERGHIIAHSRSASGPSASATVRQTDPESTSPEKPPSSGTVVDLIIRD